MLSHSVLYHIDYICIESQHVSLLYKGLAGSYQPGTGICLRIFSEGYPDLLDCSASDVPDKLDVVKISQPRHGV